MALRTLPVTLALAAGVKLTFSDALCPGARTCPVNKPVAPKPGPEILTLEMIMLALPELESVV